MKVQTKTDGIFEVTVGEHVFFIQEKNAKLQISTQFGGMAIHPTAGNVLLISESPTLAEYKRSIQEAQNYPTIQSILIEAKR